MTGLSLSRDIVFLWRLILGTRGPRKFVLIHIVLGRPITPPFKGQTARDRVQRRSFRARSILWIPPPAKLIQHMGLNLGIYVSFAGPKFVRRQMCFKYNWHLTTFDFGLTDRKVELLLICLHSNLMLLYCTIQSYSNRFLSLHIKAVTQKALFTHHENQLKRVGRASSVD